MGFKKCLIIFLEYDFNKKDLIVEINISFIYLSRDIYLYVVWKKKCVNIIKIYDWIGN